MHSHEDVVVITDEQASFTSPSNSPPCLYAVGGVVPGALPHTPRGTVTACPLEKTPINSLLGGKAERGFFSLTTSTRSIGVWYFSCHEIARTKHCDPLGLAASSKLRRRASHQLSARYCNSAERFSSKMPERRILFLFYPFFYRLFPPNHCHLTVPIVAFFSFCETP